MRLKRTKKWNKCWERQYLSIWGLPTYIQHITKCWKCNYNNKLKLNKMSYAEQLAAQAGSQAVGGIMDIALAGFRNQQQANQNRTLGKQNVAFAQEMGRFNTAQQLEIWNKTNSEAQMAHLKAAGLNPALMYGGGGAGGSTTAGSSGMGIQGGTAQVQQGGVGMNVMLPAQIKLIEAQARNLDADTAKKAGVETELGQTTIQKLIAETANVKVQTALARIQKDIMEISQEDVTDMLSLNAQKIQQELFQVKNQTDISDATKQTIIKTVGQEYLNKVLEGMATKSGIEVNNAQINKMAQDIMMGWKGMSLEERKTKIQELMGTEQKDEDQWINIINGITNTIMDGLIIKRVLGGGRTAPEVKGFRR